MVDQTQLDALVKEGVLTPRQAEVAALLVVGTSAREIAEKLNISRTAVYSQIKAIKAKGIFDSTYTPSGEVRVPPHTTAQSVLEHVTGSSQGDTSQMEVIRELIAQNSKLLEMVDRLTRGS